MTSLASYFAAVHGDCVSVSVLGLIIGLLLGALIFVLGEWLAGVAGAPVLRVVGAILGVLVFFLLGFDVTC